MLSVAYTVNPSSQQAVEGLAGSYYALSDDDNYDKYQKLLDEMNLLGLLDTFSKNPKNKDIIRELIRIYSTTIKNQDELKKYREVLDKLEE